MSGKGDRDRTADRAAYRRNWERVFGRCCCAENGRHACAACPLHGCGATEHTAHPRTHAFGVRMADGGVYPIVAEGDIS